MAFDVRKILEQLETGTPAEPGVPAWQQESWADAAGFAAALAAAHVGRGAPLKSRVGQQYDFFHDVVVRHGNSDRVALRSYERRSGWQVLGYRTLQEQAARRATEWARQGVKPGAKVCLLYSVGSELLISLAAALGLGACISFLPPEGRRFIARRWPCSRPTRRHRTPSGAAGGGLREEVLKTVATPLRPSPRTPTSRRSRWGCCSRPWWSPRHARPAPAEDAWRGALVDGLLTLASVRASTSPRPVTTRCSTCRPFSSPRCCAGPRTSTSSCRTSRPTPRCSPSTRCARSASPRPCGTCCCAPVRSSRTWPTGSATPRSPLTGRGGVPGCSSVDCPGSPPRTCSWFQRRGDGARLAAPG